MGVGASLNPVTLELARRAMGGEYGRAMRKAEFALDEVAGESENMRYARAAMRIAECAPLRVTEGERIVGAATLLEAANHRTPLVGSYSTSHLTAGFDRVLTLGYRGLRAQIESRQARGDLDEAGRDFLRAMLLCLDAAEVWRRRTVALLEERLADASGPTQAAYGPALDALRRVPEQPAETFFEAAQSLWFAYASQRLCGNWSGIGRIDQMLGPYLERDLAAGRITLDEAREVLAHLWIKGCEWTGALTDQIGSSGDAQFYQNIVLAGVDVAGRDVTNAVTYLVLDVVEALRISDFPIAVRLSERSPRQLWRRIAEVQRLGGGIVAVYNEDTILSSLLAFGYSLEQARTFANDGCWELVLPGQTCFSYRPFDALLLLQETLGVTQPVGAPIPQYDTFESLYAAYLARLADYLDEFHRQADTFELGGRAAPLISLLVDDCIERARGYHDRGARYTVFAPHAGGLPDVVNSLLAIRSCVYERGELTLGEMVEALRSDWAGREALRRRIRGELVGYGNGDPTADALARRVFDDYTALAGRVRERAGVLRPAGISTFGRQIEWAAKRGATAAGTHKGEYLANNFSPSPGADREGPTAVIRSFCAVDYTRLPNGTALELKVHPSAVKGEEGLDVLVALMRTFVQLGGVFLHIDVVDSDLLREAQAHPDRYPTLAVRVSGWSARFATLSRDWQDMIIERTEQDLR